MKKINKVFFIAVAASLLSACQLYFIPDGTTVLEPEKSLIQTEDDLLGYETSIYYYFRACQGAGAAIPDDLMFDGFNATQNNGNRYGGIHKTDGNFTSGDEYVENFWGNNYICIAKYNIVLAAAEEVEDPFLKEGADFVAAEARLARAASYLALARRFGPDYEKATAATDLCVPLVLKYDQNERPARATVKEVYDAIKADLDICLEAFKDVHGKVASEYFTIDVVKALLANYYLDVEDYKNASKYAFEIIDSNVYALAKTKADLDKQYKSDSGSEAIMQLPASLQELPGSYGEYQNYSSSDKNSPTGTSYSAGYIPSQVLIDAYEKKDYRLLSWFDDCTKIPYLCEGNYYTGKFFVFSKFEGNVELSSTGNKNGCVAPKPFLLPEIYLIAAEASFKANKKVDALAALTTLQSARNATPTDDVTLEAIQKEWFRETVGDGKRLECLKRWKLGFSGRDFQPGAENVVIKTAGYVDKVFKSDDYHMCWPIPSYEIKVNSNLRQNTGYSAQ